MGYFSDFFGIVEILRMISYSFYYLGKDGWLIIGKDYN